MFSLKAGSQYDVSASVALRCLSCVVYVTLHSFGSQFCVIAVAQLPGNTLVAHLATDQRNGEQ